ncbi:MAG: transposase [Clostridia bacterium]|nr:transposase [Clostridia bacterium]
MSTKNKYTSEFKKTVVNLYHSGKNYAQIHNEYGVSLSVLSKWVKLYSEVKIDDDTVITAHFSLFENTLYTALCNLTPPIHCLASAPNHLPEYSFQN